MGSLLSGLSDFVTYLVGGTIGTGSEAVTVDGIIPSFVEVITDNPLLLLFVVAIPVVGIGVGFLRSLFHVRGN